MRSVSCLSLAVACIYANAATGILPVVNINGNSYLGGFEIKNQYISAQLLTPHPITQNAYPMIDKLYLLGTEVIPNDNAGANLGFALRNTNLGFNYNPTVGGDCAGNSSALVNFPNNSSTMSNYINWLPPEVYGSPAMGMKLDVMPRDYGRDGFSCPYGVVASIPKIPIYSTDPAPSYSQGAGAAFRPFIFTLGVTLGSDGSQGLPANGLSPLGMLLDLTITRTNSTNPANYPQADQVAPVQYEYNKEQVETPSMYLNNIWRYAYKGVRQGGYVQYVKLKHADCPSRDDVSPATYTATGVCSNNVTTWPTGLDGDGTTNFGKAFSDSYAGQHGVNSVAVCNTTEDNPQQTCVALYSENLTASAAWRATVGADRHTLVGLGMGGVQDADIPISWVAPSVPSQKFRRLLAFGNFNTINAVISQSRTANHFAGYQ